ncbi:MAG: energy-coupling factor transporter ATPase [bacterium]|nr:energy-coupling factor transporter ATPase [bacterium]
MSNLIEVKNIVFEYESDDAKKNVLNDFSVSFEQGSFTAVLGHNGSGKSTLAKLLNGLYKPLKGKIIVDGIDTNDPEREIDIKRSVGVVFQNPDNQIIATVVEEDVAFGLENLGIPYDIMHERVESALEAVGMAEYRKSSPHKLSGGQKQRVAIAGIVAMQPKCIVLDEPTSMLDPQGRKDVISTITKLCKEKGITVILITHYMNEAACADRVVVMDRGKIVLDDKPNVVFSNVELLKSIGLDVPQPTELAYQLNRCGIEIDNTIITVDDCVENLKKIFLEEK